jgi:hypothetical protein
MKMDALSMSGDVAVIIAAAMSKRPELLVVEVITLSSRTNGATDGLTVVDSEFLPILLAVVGANGKTWSLLSMSQVNYDQSELKFH